MRRATRHLFVGAWLSLAAIAPAQAGETPQQRVAFEKSRRKILARPGMAKMMHDLPAADVQDFARLECLVAIEKLCRLVEQADADQIIANGQAVLEKDWRMIADADVLWAQTNLHALRVGATQSAELRDAVDAHGRKKFAKPGGSLSTIMARTDKPQEIAPGVPATPRISP
jgi:hypothetical protein